MFYSKLRFFVSFWFNNLESIMLGSNLCRPYILEKYGWPTSINVSAVLTDDRQLRSLIGLGRDDFEKLSNEFTSCLNEKPG